MRAKRLIHLSLPLLRFEAATRAVRRKRAAGGRVGRPALQQAGRVLPSRPLRPLRSHS
jgi:hypothetical protein